MDELILQIVSETVSLAIVMYGWRNESKRLDIANDKLYSLIPEADAVVLSSDDLKAVNPSNAERMVEAATHKQ